MSKLMLTQVQVIESVMASIGLGIAAIDKNGSILYCNSAATDLVGMAMEAEPIEPQDWPKHYGVYLPDGITRCPESLVVSAIAGEEGNNVEVLIQNQLGSNRSHWCNINFRPLLTDDGQIAGAVLLIQDMSERKRLADEAARSNAALQQFATVAAHDLQEPLRSIAGFADMLAQYQKENLDERSTRCMTKIRDGILRMQTLINDLLTYSRIQTKPQVLRPVDCNELVNNCIRSLNASIIEAGATISFESLPTVVADASRLSQLFQNLVGNALKYRNADRPPVVTISAKQQGLFWLFSVEDNGIGIAPEFTERIFGVFQRLHNKSTFTGTGIGLAICQVIVDRHAGRIWVESEPGVGSIFYFTIPKSSAEDRP